MKVKTFLIMIAATILMLNLVTAESFSEKYERLWQEKESLENDSIDSNVRLLTYDEVIRVAGVQQADKLQNEGKLMKSPEFKERRLKEIEKELNETVTDMEKEKQRHEDLLVLLYLACVFGGFLIAVALYCKFKGLSLLSNSDV